MKPPPQELPVGPAASDLPSGVSGVGPEGWAAAQSTTALTSPEASAISLKSPLANGLSAFYRGSAGNAGSESGGGGGGVGGARGGNETHVRAGSRLTGDKRPRGSPGDPAGEMSPARRGSLYMRAM